MADSYDISITQGEDAQISIRLTNADATPLNLSGYLVRGKVKHSYSQTGYVYDLSPSITSAVSGLVEINIAALDSATLPVIEAFYDIERYTADDASVSKVLKGKFLVYPEATN